MGNSAYSVKSTHKSFQYIHLILGRYITDILEMCMKEFNASFFLQINSILDLANFRPIHILNNG